MAVELSCSECGTTYQAMRRSSRYCSPLCASRAKEARRGSRAGRITRRQRTCEWCGHTYTAQPQSKACSSECRNALWTRVRSCRVPWKQCPTCQEWWIGRGARKHCSEFCLRVGGYRRLASPIEYGACLRCGGTFVRRVGQLGRYCSRRCSKATEKRNRAHIQRSRTKRGERITLVELGDRDGWRCHICGKTVTHRPGNLPGSPSIDHLVPLSKDGEHRWTNVALAHRSCNTVRGATGSAQLRLIA